MGIEGDSDRICDLWGHEVAKIPRDAGWPSM